MSACSSRSLCLLNTASNHARNLLQPLTEFNLRLIYHGSPNELRNRDIKRDLLETLKHTPKSQPKNVTHLAVTCVAGIARILPHIESIKLEFKFTNGLFAAFLLEKSSSKPLRIVRVCHLTRNDPVSNLPKGSSESIQCRSKVTSHYSVLDFGDYETEDFAKQVDQYLRLIVSEGLQPNPKLQRSDWFEFFYQQLSSWKHGVIDLSDPFLANRLTISLENHLNLPDTAIGHSCETCVTTKNDPMVRSSKTKAWSPIRQGDVHRREGGMRHHAFVALGSNLGDRLAYIEKAAAEMERLGLKLRQFGHVYETEPMYLTDQPAFFNTVCEVSPLLLLDVH